MGPANLDKAPHGRKCEETVVCNSPAVPICGDCHRTLMTQIDSHSATNPPLRRIGLRGRLAATVAGRRRLSGETRRLLPLVAPVALGGIAAVVAALWSFAVSSPDGHTIAAAAAFLLAAAIAEGFPVPLDSVAVGGTSLATVFIITTAVLYGWTVATPVAAFAMAAVELARRRELIRVTYNTGVYALAAVAAGTAAAAVHGSNLGQLAAATLVAGLAFYAVNITLVAAVVGRSSGEPSRTVLRRYVSQTLVPLGVMVCVALVLVVVWDRSPLAAVALAGPLASIVIYERRMYEAFVRLREVDRMKDEFIAIVSHELRTPLASVYGAAITLQRDVLEPKTRNSLLEVVYNESARLARLVDQVLSASRLESGGSSLAVEPVDASRVAREVVESIRPRLPSALHVDLVHAAPPPFVAADAEKLKQVLVNLVENAVKYSPEGGRIQVRLAPAGDQVRFSVQDEGIGMPSGEQEHIFEKFHRLDPNLTRGVGGTGLGLYICREFLQRMGGRIWVESELGTGSTFSFELPRADSAPGADANTE
jgi:signal transduction histidine kinase